MSILLRRYTALVVVLIMCSAVLVSPASAITWGAVRPITTSGQAAAWAGSTTAYGTGNVAVIYVEAAGDEVRVHLRRSTDGGTTWTTPKRLSSTATTFASRAAVASNGWKLDAVFVEERMDGSAKVMYRRSGDGGQTWSTPLALSPTGARGGFPSVTRDGQGRVAVAWTNELTGKVSVRVSTDSGASFGPRKDIATSTNQPWVDFDDFAVDAFPAVAIAGGTVNVAYYTSLPVLKLRRSTDGGATWTPSVTLASNGNGFKPALVAGGTSLLVGYAVYTGTDIYTAYRRSTNKGGSWSSPASLSSPNAAPSYQPVISFRGGRWRIALERCLDDTCLASDAFYRHSADGLSWSTVSRVTDGPNDYQTPVGIDLAQKVIVAFTSYDPIAETQDILIRPGS
jgi:hypothetical protein